MASNDHGNLGIEKIQNSERECEGDWFKGPERSKQIKKDEENDILSISEDYLRRVEGPMIVCYNKEKEGDDEYVLVMLSKLNGGKQNYNLFQEIRISIDHVMMAFIFVRVKEENEEDGLVGLEVVDYKRLKMAL